MIPIPQITWGQWKADYAETLVLSPDTAFQDRYLRPVEIGVFNPNEAIYGDDRLPSNELIVGVEVDGVFKGYPISELEENGMVVNDTVAGKTIVVVYDSAPGRGWPTCGSSMVRSWSSTTAARTDTRSGTVQPALCGMYMAARLRAHTGKGASNSFPRSYPSGTAGPPTTRKHSCTWRNMLGIRRTSRPLCNGYF